MEYTIELYPNCFTPSIQVTIRVPYNRDPEEYIDSLLDNILSEDARYNCEWNFK